MEKQLRVKLFSDSSPTSFQGAVNLFLSNHEVSKITYSTSTCMDGGEAYCLFSALVVYFE